MLSLLAILALLVPQDGGAQPGPPQAERVDNAQVVAMVKAGLPEDVIIASIRGKPTGFDTSPDALIALKAQGASDALIRAVVATAELSPPAESTSGAEPSPIPLPADQPLDSGTVAVMDFDYGTLNNWWGQYDIGRGMADQVVNGLVNDGTYRVIERKKLDTVLAEQDFSRSDRAAPSAAKLSELGRVLGVRYIIAGSITKFGTEEKSYGTAGIPLVPGPLGLFRLKKAKTYVTLTARLIDTTTGEVITSVKGEGLSKKGGGLGLAAASTGLFGFAGMDTPTFKASAVGEAEEHACQSLIKELVAKKNELKPQD
jgi:curli biogenesis system outer membrane secretion channel CsgG